MNADIVITKIDSRNSRMSLRAGAKGTGKTLHSVTYWPNSPRSEEAAYNMIRNEAERLGVTLTQHEPND